MAPPLVCLTNVYVLGNMPDRKTPYMLQYLFNVQRELGGSTALEVGYLGSRSYRLERMFDWNETIPGVTGSVQSRKPYPEFTKVQEIGNVAEAKYNSLAVKLTRRLHHGLSVLGGYTFSKSTDNGSGIRTLNGDTLFPQDSFCLECEWGLSVFDVRHRFVASVLYELPFGDGKPFLQSGVGGGDSRRLADQHDHLERRAAFRERPTSAPTGRTPAAARIARTSTRTGSGSAERPANDRAVVQHRRVRAATRRARGATPAATRSSVRASPTSTRRSSGTSGCGQQDAAVPARGVQRVEQPDLERPEHDVDEPALRHDQRARRKPMREMQLGLKFVF